MNKCIHYVLICACLLCIHIPLLAQTDSSVSYSLKYERILGKTDFSTGKIRGLSLGDSITTILHSEKAILEAQGDDFLYYRVLCDSTLSAEVSYTFDEKGRLISIGIEFFESCKNNLSENLSDEFLTYLTRYYGESRKDESGFLKWNVENGLQIEFQKMQNEMCIIHTQMEFY